MDSNSNQHQDKISEEASSENVSAPPPVESSSVNKKQSGVVSSLFTSNPEVTQRPKLVKKTDYTPSNGIITCNNTETTSLKNDGFMKFLDARLAGYLSAKMQINQPTPIQLRAIPRIIESRTSAADFIIHAQTGSGKTLCYLLPVLQRLLTMAVDQQGVSRRSGINALILLPTRELAQQVYALLEQILRMNYHPRWIVPCLLSGGEKKKAEKARLRKGVTILVGTPGRVLDHLKTTQCLDLKTSLEYLILDEADRFEEMGFHGALKEIIALMQGHNTRRWNMILCSATLSRNAKSFGDCPLRNVVYISAQDAIEEKATETTVDSLSVPNQLKQYYLVVPAKLRLVTFCGLLKKIIQSKSDQKLLVFFSNCDSVDFHHQLLTDEHLGAQRAEDDNNNREDDVDKALKEFMKAQKEDDDSESEEDDEEKSVAAVQPSDSVTRGRPLCPLFGENTATVYKLHSKISHSDRIKTINAFTHAKNTTSVLFCTDIAARGLDLPLQVIVQYDPPADRRDYIHRVGRTARIGRGGEAYLFLMPHEVGYLDRLTQDGITGSELAGEQCLKALLSHEQDVASDTFQSSGSKKIPRNKGREDPDFLWKEEATRWQLTFERYTNNGPRSTSAKMKKLAAQAYHSTIRAYTTHQKEDKCIFNKRQLHLGHLAKAFTLRDPPGRLQAHVDGVKQRKRQQKEQSAMDRKVVDKTKMLTTAKRTLVSEFDAGGQHVLKRNRLSK